MNWSHFDIKSLIDKMRGKAEPFNRIPSSFGSTPTDVSRHLRCSQSDSLGAIWGDFCWGIWGTFSMVYTSWRIMTEKKSSEQNDR